MTFEAVSKVVKGVPYIGVRNARYLYDLIIRERITRILELGIAHGTATCFMAAALEELQGGTITSVDLIEAQSEFIPTPEEQLAKANLSQFVSIVRMKTGYNWFLHDEIKRLTNNDVCAPDYDLCIIDGPKNWTIDGCAFFLVDKILRNNGWIIFDDYNWTYADAESRRDETDGVTHRTLSEAERSTPHIREVFELLVKQHPDYAEFHRIDGSDWAIARKSISLRKIYTICHRETGGDLVANAWLTIKRWMKQFLGL
jgi:predicted O-methyltransferase YrrM